MADIIKELNARLADVAKRRDAEDERHEGVHQTLDREVEIIKAMLALEEGRSSNGYAVPAQRQRPLRAGAGNAVESEILEALSDRKEWFHADIKAHLIEQRLGSEKDPNFGRSLQGVLLSLRGRELVEHSDTAQWKITKKGLSAE